MNGKEAKMSAGDDMHWTELVKQAREVEPEDDDLIIRCDVPQARITLDACEVFYGHCLTDEQHGDAHENGHVYRVSRWTVETDSQGFKDLTEHGSTEEAVAYVESIREEDRAAEIAELSTLTLPDGTEYAGTLRYDDDGEPIIEEATCGACGFTWNDALGTKITPVPSGRTPCEYSHTEQDAGCDRCGADDRAAGSTRCEECSESTYFQGVLSSTDIDLLTAMIDALSPGDEDAERENAALRATLQNFDPIK